jgi:hypothetical protein
MLNKGKEKQRTKKESMGVRYASPWQACTAGEDVPAMAGGVSKTSCETSPTWFASKLWRFARMTMMAMMRFAAQTLLPLEGAHSWRGHTSSSRTRAHLALSQCSCAVSAWLAPSVVSIRVAGPFIRLASKLPLSTRLQVPSFQISDPSTVLRGSTTREQYSSF